MRIERWANALVLILATLVGIAAFAYPFFSSGIQPGPTAAAHADDAPLVTLVLTLLCTVIVVANLTSRQMSARTIAVLGVLSAVNAVLRAVPGPAGFSAIFFLLALCGYVYGSTFGFLMGVLSLLVALREDISENRDAEARDHVKRFHELFFTLEPDKQYIENNVREALYLADRSAMEQYQSFKENNVYNQVIASDISMTVQTDSIKLDFSGYPYRFSYFGKQKIVRTSNITIRNLQTTGQLRNISRTDHNPHGFLIEGWQIIDNTDMETIKRKSF